MCRSVSHATVTPAKHGSTHTAAGTAIPVHIRTIPEGGNMAVKVSMKVNGKPVSADVEARTLLVTFIREQLHLTGTHVGCDTAQCGACTVQLNGKAVKSCSMLAMQAEGADVLTIEGVAKADGTLHPMQAAFKEHHGLQCGFCTPGMVMSAIDFAKGHPGASEKEVREALEGNLCRCTGYHNIVKAIMAGSKAMAAAK
jgi:carbon-monoxide dehydrogenase small subunit